jgi:hypothetical protein
VEEAATTRPKKCVPPEVFARVNELSREKIGARRIRKQILREFGFKISTGMIATVIHEANDPARTLERMCETVHFGPDAASQRQIKPASSNAEIGEGTMWTEPSPDEIDPNGNDLLSWTGSENSVPNQLPVPSFPVPPRMIDPLDAFSRMYIAKANSEIISKVDRATNRALGLDPQDAVSSASEKRDEQETEEGRRRRAEFLELRKAITEYMEKKQRPNIDEGIASESEAQGVRTEPGKEQDTFQIKPPSAEPDQTKKELEHCQDSEGDGIVTPAKMTPAVFNAQGEAPTVQSSLDPGPKEPASGIFKLQVAAPEQVTEERILMNQEGGRDTTCVDSTQKGMTPLVGLSTKSEGEAREVTIAGAKAPPLEPQDVGQILEAKTSPDNEPALTRADTRSKDLMELQKPSPTFSSHPPEGQNREYPDSTKQSALSPQRLLIGQPIPCCGQQEVDDSRSTGEEGAGGDSDYLLLPAILVGVGGFFGAAVYDWLRRQPTPPTRTQNGPSDPSNLSLKRESRSPNDPSSF